MSDNGFKVKNKINIKPGGETLDAEGDIAFNSTSHKLEVRDNSATRSMVSEDGTQTLTNKSISGSSNTLSNVPASAVNTGAATTLDLATSNTASTVNIGTGTDTNVVNIGGANTTVNITGSVNNQAVTNLNVSDKLITINDGGAAASGGSAGIEIEENGSATGYVQTSSNRNSWAFKAPNTNGVATLTPGASNDDIVLEDATQTLTNKTISGASNTLTNIPNSALDTVAETKGGTNQTTYTTGDILYASASNTISKRAIGSSGQVLTVSGGVPTWAAASGSANPAILLDKQSSGTAGGTATGATWTARNLNTITSNADGIIVNSSSFTGSGGTNSTVTLAAGTYEVYARSPHYMANRYAKCRLYNATDASVIEVGSGAYNNNGTDDCEVFARFTLASQKSIELQYYFNSANGGSDLGIAVSTGSDEVFAMMVIKKVL